MLTPPSGNLLSPESAHARLLHAGGQENLPRYTELLQAFGVPWGVVADGKAF
jgi:hypothetical protein